MNNDGVISSQVMDVNGTDVPGNASTTTVLAVGATVQGDVGSVSDSDWYQITLVAGQTYYFALNGTGAGALGDPYLTLYGLNYANIATSLAANNDSGAGSNAFMTYKATTSGTYYIAASGYAWSQGHYSLSSGVMPADTIPGDATTTATLTVGQSVVGVATDNNDTDWYAIQLTAGVTYEVNLTSTAVGGISGLDWGGLNVLSYDPTAPVDNTIKYLAASSFTPSPTQYSPYTDSAHTYFTPTSSGTYYISAASLSSGNGGGYTVGVVTAPADIDAAGPVHLDVGSSISSIFATPTDTDTYHVDLVAGQTYLFHVDASGDQPTQATTIQINGQSGTSGDLYSGITGNVRFTPTFTGTYSLVVGGFGGSYTVAAETTTSELPASPATTGTVSIGHTTNGYIDAQGDTDWYAVTLVAGQTYSFSMVDRFSHFMINNLNLVSSAGTVLASGVHPIYNNDSDFVYTATTSGTYYLSASLGAGWPYGDYSIKAIAVNDAQGQAAATAQHIAVGQVASGEVDFVGDQDWYALDVVSGYTYSFDAYSTSSDPLQYLNLAVVNAAGSYLPGATGNNSGTESHDTFTASATGTIYLSLGTNQGFSHGGYTLNTLLIDTVSSNVDTTASIALGQSFSSTIDYATSTLSFSPDTDLIEVTLQAGQSYDFTATGSGAVPTDPVLNLLDAYGNPLYGNIAAGNPHHLEYYAEQSGNYYIRVNANNPLQLGGYTVTANLTNDVFDQSNTRTLLTPGTTLHSTIDNSTDQDWFKVTLTAGQSYLINVVPDGGTPVGGAVFVVMNSETGVPAQAVAGSGAIPNSSELRYTPTTSGTYYIDVSSINGGTGGYAVSATPVAAQNPATTIDSGHTLASGAVTVYFATSGEAYDGHAAGRSWTASEITDFLAAAGTWANVTNVSFSQTTNAASAGLVVMLDATSGVTSIAASEGTPQVAVLNQNAITSGLAPGGSGFEYVLKATGYALGLTTPDGWSPTHEPMEGVQGPGFVGVGQLNQDIYTVMASTSQISTGFLGYSGGATGPMALDIAAIQAKYGAVAHNAGDTTYTLPSVASGFATIWDTGGTDTISAVSAVGGVIIDLRPASLTAATGGGGYVSYTYHVAGGFTIAHGVVIENAAGGAYADTLTGNDADNVLNGGDGDDTLLGGLGNDTLIGGNGNDTVSFAGASVGVVVDLGLTTAQNTHQGMDTLSSIEEFYGSDYNDTVKVTSSTTYVDGAGGTDTMVFSGNYADYTLTSIGARNAFVGNGGTVFFNNIENFQFADKTVDLVHLTNVAPYITGDLNAIMAANSAYTLTTDDLSFVDPNNAFVTYTVAYLLGGSVFVDGIQSTSFTSDQVAGGHVSFHQSGSGASAIMNVSASDGQLTDPYNGGIGVTFQVIQSPGQIISGDASNNTLTGTAAGDAIYGNGGNDIIHTGGTGSAADYIFGGAGNDLIIDEGGNVTIDGGDGTDTVTFASATSAVTVTDAMATSITGTVYTHLANVENITGSAFNDQIQLNSYLDNVIDGGAGADSMAAGYGNDTYYVDNIGDVVTENAGSGIDTVMSTVSYALADNVENLTLLGSANLNATGNNLHNTLIGNSGDNIIDGGGAPDIMMGGAGNDTYYVDNVLDVVTENANEGIDSIMSSVSYALGANVENLTLTGNGNVNAVGNALDNRLTGNSGDNVLTAGTGRDTIDGGAGSDTAVFNFASTSAHIVSGGGALWVYNNATSDVTELTNVETLQFSDKSLASTGTFTPFNALEYIASNADLLVGYGDNVTAATQHYIDHGYAEHRNTDAFNALEYIASNADLLVGYGDNVTAATQHYIDHGYAEHRNTGTFNALEYIASNADLLVGYGDNVTAATLHYIDHGYVEHRNTGTFNALEYIASNADLLVGYGDNVTAATLHYIDHGYAEGRATGSFDALEYLASNADLLVGYGADVTAATLHYIDHGYAEGRSTGSFNAVQYLNNYADLKAAFGNDLHAAELHYILYGYAEHRTDHALP